MWQLGVEAAISSLHHHLQACISQGSPGTLIMPHTTPSTLANFILQGGRVIMRCTMPQTMPLELDSIS